MNSRNRDVLNKTIIIIMAVLTAYLLYLNFLYSAYNNALIYTLLVVPTVFIIYLLAYKINISPLAFFITIFVLAFFSKGLIAITSNTLPISDFNTFYNCAVRLINGDKSFGHGFYFTSFAYQTGPVIYYSMIMKLFGTGLLPLKLVNCFFMAGSNSLVYLIARKISNDYTARFAALLYLLYPAPYFLAPVLTNQHFAACMFLLSIYLLLETRINFPLRNLTAGIVLSFGNTVRPLGVVILGGVVVWAITQSIRDKKLVRIGGSVIMIAAYLLMSFTFSTIVKKANINPEGLNNNYPLWKFVVGFNYETKGTFSYPDQNEIFYIDDFEKRNEVSKRVIKERISISPAKMFNLINTKQKIMWSNFDTMKWGFYDKVDNHLVPSEILKKYELPILKTEKMYYILAFMLMFAGLFLTLRKKTETGIVLIASILGCYFAAHAIIEVQVRYRYFAIMLVFVLAAKGSELLMSGFHGYRKKYRL
ncbi:glycosyltransferase family 39 protein [Ruminiclostridium cellulolyticum]|uniref:Uncharacterized protein n=1 Tax=Ruminiclostridium cellulolyticum (strain ATCC 35319 / DSM 5812 / JCM 6584 / H10) TaxID=394503 RepID=B8I0T7_RUMCH|nr:glycosyltransferase family 39 protein [Ruminiclostridium cellulolyticum]ACL75662.1 conserved hypothetical protein [Ruminiclostridium cellulolyticum H10]